MQSPSPVNQQPDAEQFPPEVYPLAAAYQMGVPLLEHVYPTNVTSCFIFGVVGLLCIGGLIAGVSGLTYFVVSSHLLPTPFVKSAAFEWSVLGLGFLAIIAGGIIIPSYLLRDRILRRKEEERRNRFRGTQLVYACTNGMLWLDRGKVSAAYPWQTIESVRRVVSRGRGGTHISWWLDLTDGSQEQIDHAIVSMVEAYLQSYRLDHGLPATQAYGYAGGKRWTRPRYTMRGRGRWTWSTTGFLLMLFLFPMLVYALFLLLYWLAHP